MARMPNPPHPGLALRDDVLPSLGMNVTEVAAALGVSRVALSRLLNGAAGLSPEMALRLERWLGPERGCRADVWMGMQQAYDLAAAEERIRGELRRIKPLPAPVGDGGR